MVKAEAAPRVPRNSRRFIFGLPCGRNRSRITGMRKMSRREFVAGTAMAIAGAPALLRGRNLNDKLDIAFIACGGRALTSLNELTITPGQQDRKRTRLNSSHIPL